MIILCHLLWEGRRLGLYLFLTIFDSHPPPPRFIFLVLWFAYHFYADFTPLAGFPKSDISGTSKSSGLHHCVTCWHPAFERHHRKVIWWFGVWVGTQIAGMCSDPERRKGTLHPQRDFGSFRLVQATGFFHDPLPMRLKPRAPCRWSAGRAGRCRRRICTTWNI